MRKRSIIGTALAAATLALGLTSSAQAGSSTVWGCKPGNVCVYYYTSIPSAETPRYQTGSGFSQSMRIQRLLNNGRTHHISYSGSYSGGHSFRGCLPYNTSSGSPTSASYINLTGYLGQDVWIGEAWFGSGSCGLPKLQVHRVAQDTNPYWVTLVK
jgi:hypothetical protein